MLYPHGLLAHGVEVLLRRLPCSGRDAKQRDGSSEIKVALAKFGSQTLAACNSQDRKHPLASCASYLLIHTLHAACARRRKTRSHPWHKMGNR